MKEHEQEAVTHCGILGIVARNTSQPVDVVGYGVVVLEQLNHRGHEGVGMNVFNQWGETHTIKGEGTSHSFFTPERMNELRSLSPLILIGQDRYSTAGTYVAWPPYTDPRFSLVHNGNGTNPVSLCRKYGIPLEYMGSDTHVAFEVYKRLLDFYNNDYILAAKALQKDFEGAANFLISTPHSVIGTVDPRKFHPLCIGSIGDDAYIAASEDSSFLYTLPKRGVKIRDVDAGECFEMTPDGIESHGTIQGNLSRCSFEHTYFTAPDTTVDGKNSAEVRERCCRLHAAMDLEDGLIPEVVVPVQLSGINHAQGYARNMILMLAATPEKYGISREAMPRAVSRIQTTDALVTNKYAGRVFINANGHEESTRAKHRPNRVQIEKKKVVVVDDSIVKGPTSEYTMQLLKDAGAREIHLRVGFGAIKNSCYMGVDFANPEKLLWNKVGSEKEMADYLGITSVRFLSPHQVLGAIQDKEFSDELPARVLYQQEGYCGACMTGHYPLNINMNDLMMKS